MIVFINDFYQRFEEDFKEGQTLFKDYSKHEKFLKKEEMDSDNLKKFLFFFKEFIEAPIQAYQSE